MIHSELERLMDTYGDGITRMCYLYLKDWYLAEEATQETFIKAYRYFDTFRNEASEKTWLTQIAINTCKNYARTSWFKRVQVGTTKKEESIGSFEEELLSTIEQNEVLNQVSRLQHKYKEVILLYYYQEMKVSEIAEILDISEGTVKMRLNRARKKLRECLREVSLYG